jgi:cell division protein ZapD
MLRLEQLFERLATLTARDAALDHHFALFTLFEIMDVASRADLKSDLLKELERHRQLLQGYRGNPQVSATVLEQVLSNVEQAFEALHAVPGKAGQALAGNDWLMSIRSRIAIPGGTCSFDLPGYHAWQQLDVYRRRADLERWRATVQPLEAGLQVLLGLVRDSGTPQRVLAGAGQYQQRLPEGKVYHLLRLRLDSHSGLVPEISGNRLMLSVRLMRPDADGRLKPALEDTPLEIALCA